MNDEGIQPDDAAAAAAALAAERARLNADNAQNPPIPANPNVGAQNEFYRLLINQLRHPRTHNVKSVPCSVYNLKSDFDQWVTSFEDAVRACHGLRMNDAALPELYLNWIATRLETGDTRAIFENLGQNVKGSWTLLKPALSTAFRDEAEESKFLNDESWWRYTPKTGMTLRDYKVGLLSKMQKYLGSLRAVNSEFERTAVRRFRLGIEDPVLQAHLLMSCTGDKMNLESAYSIASTYENTLCTIGKDAPTIPNMAAMLTIPNLGALSADVPHFAGLTTYQERTNERLDALELSSKKNDLNISEIKTGLTEVKDGMGQLQHEMQQLKLSSYPRTVKPFYPVSRMPLANPYQRSYSQQPGQFARFPTVKGLTGGPGYVNRPFRSQPIENRLSNLAQASNQSTKIGAPAAAAASAPNLGSVEVDPGEGQAAGAASATANANLQHGSHDVGFGWYEPEGYDYAFVDPEGRYEFDPSFSH